MSQTVVVSGQNYTIPDVGEDDWGQDVTDYLVALAVIASGSQSFMNLVNVTTTPITIVSGRTYLVNTSTAKTLNLPAAALNAFFFVKDITGSASSNNITIARAGSESIDGVAGNRTLAQNLGSWCFMSDGTNWHLLQLRELNIGLAGGRTLVGGNAASENLTLQSTSHATKGKVIIGTSAYDEVNNRLGIATSTPSVPLDVVGAVKATGALTLTPTSNQIVLGTTRTVTLTAPTPAASSRTWTIPDLSGDATFAALEAAQTFSGAKTFSAAVAITLASGNSLIVDTTTFVVDATNNRVGMGTATPARLLEIVSPDGVGTGDYIVSITNNDVTNGESGGLLVQAGNNASDTPFAVKNRSASITIINTTGDGKTSLGGSLTVTPTSNQIVLGTTRTVTLTAPTPASTSRVMTIPDVSADASFVLTEGAQTINGVKTFASQLIAKGTATNDSAASGNIGEYMSASTAGASAPLDNVWGDAASLNLTAGDWDVTAVGFWDQNSATWTQANIGISVTAGNDTTGLTLGDTRAEEAFASSGTTPKTAALSLPAVRMSLSGSTTVYLKYEGRYSAGAPLFSGRISARRVR